MDRRTTSRGVSQVPAVLRLRVDASICATEPNTPAPHGYLDRWPEVALYCSRAPTDNALAHLRVAPALRCPVPFWRFTFSPLSRICSDLSLIHI